VPRIRMLRSGQLASDRFFTIGAGILSPGQWEAWFACARVTGYSGVGATSDTLRVAASPEELQAWADDLTPAQIDELARTVCP
jgi:hypothetical protein